MERLCPVASVLCSENANARPATRQLGKNVVSLFSPVFPGFLCFSMFFLCFSAVFFGFCNPFLVSLKYATPTFFTHFLCFEGICRASQQS